MTVAPPDQALDLARLRQRFIDHANQGAIRADQLADVMTHLDRFVREKPAPASQCWQCQADVSHSGQFCARCGSNVISPEAQEMRGLESASRAAHELLAAGVIDADQAEVIEAQVRLERQALSETLFTQRAGAIDLQLIRKRQQEAPGTKGQADPPNVAGPMTPPPRRKRRTLLEILLDPQSIQWMLGCGGVLLVVGVVIFLASKGLFENPINVAGVMGIGSIAVLSAGSWLFLKTRYSLAGRATTLLACLAMPLNLWFYHAQGLMSLDGKLWVPAMVICLLYAATAYLLRDPMFVYVMIAGVMMTGSLILGDLGRLTEISAPATLAMVLGLLCLHAERIFTVSDDAIFSRKKFGSAFFWSAQVLVFGSLALVLGRQVVGYAGPMFYGRSIESMTHSMKLLQLALVLCGAYAAVWSSVVVRRKVVYTYFAAGTLLWAELIGIDLVGAKIGIEMVMGLMSLTALASILVVRFVGTDNMLVRPLRPIGFVLGMLAVVLGAGVQLQSHWPHAADWGFVAAMLFAAAVSRTGAWANRLQTDRYAKYFYVLSGVGVLVAAKAALDLVGVSIWQEHLLLLVPIGYLISSRLHGARPLAAPAAMVAEISAVLITFIAIVTEIPSATLPLAGFCLEAAVVFALLSTWRHRAYALYATLGLIGLSAWQTLGAFDASKQTYVLSLAGYGLSLLVLYRFAAAFTSSTRLVKVSFNAGNLLLLFTFVAGTLMTLADFLGNRIALQQLVLTGALGCISLLAAMPVGKTSWRRWHLAAAIGSGALAAICLKEMSNLSFGQSVELFCITIGLALLGAGHVGWYREQHRTESDTVTFSLAVGALLVCVPLAIAAYYTRAFTPGLSLVDEFGLLTMSILLLLSGLVFKLRDTTLVGGAFLACHLVVLMVAAGMRAQLALGVYLTLGGAALFGVGLLLSLSREKLLALPTQIKQREGMFKVLGWR